MFGIGTGELLLLALIALLVLGPERMPKLMRDVGKTMGDLRKTSDELRSELLNADRSIDAEKVLDLATRLEPSEGKAAETGATTGETLTPSAPTAPDAAAEVVTPPMPPEPEETAFDREARLARERLARSKE